MFKNDKPVIIDDQYLLTSLYYTGRNSVYYNAVLTKDDQKSGDILVQIVTNQSQCYCRLYKKTSDNGITPKIHQFGILKVGETSYHYIVQQKAGPSLKLCFQLMKRKFSISTIALVALKMITHLQQLHSLNIIHRCLKLSNLISTLQSEIYFTHFEYSSKYMDKNGKILIKKKNKLNLHSFITIDDLESLFYILLHIITLGKFLHSQPNVERQEKLKYYYEIKQRFVPERELKGFPEQFLQLYHGIRLLQPHEFPNYDQLKQPFFQLLGQQDLQLQFDWIPLLKPKNKNSRSPSPIRISKLKHAGSVGDMAFISQQKKDDQILDSVSPQRQGKPTMKHFVYPTNKNATERQLPAIQEGKEGTLNSIAEKNQLQKKMGGLSIIICKQQVTSSSSSGNVSSMSDDQSEVDTKPLNGIISKLYMD
ncbi:unnamed protein product [Paramecium octaurelia]|uniref:Protein kinase domain-containing protein n=1 Tax=Paramecium octaurelia TaxID=43137 RepID=A0A8S1SRL2_PAROT|nr:unnamed protein product [Paramecium octaurelia]